jgi:DNA-binding IclR family transcriptional regulator
MTAGGVQLQAEPATGLPLRQLTRLRAEMAIAAAQLTATLFPEQPMLGIEFGIVARVCLPDWVDGRAIRRPAAPERSIAVRQIALSLGTAPETTRRHVNMLAERGILDASSQGVALAVTAANEVLVQRYYTYVHDLFLSLVEGIGETCDLDLPVGDGGGVGVADVIERTLDVLLLPIDSSRLMAGNPQTLLLWAALTVIAVRRVTFDPVLARRYADAIPPDSVRYGISLRRLAAAIAVPYATAWRHLKALDQRGLVSRLDGDLWTVLRANLLDEGVSEISTRPSLHVLRKVRELTQLGLDPAAVEALYLEQRPAPAAFDLSQNG